MSNASCLRLSGPVEWDALERLVDKLALSIDEDKLYQDYTVLNDVFESIPEELAPDKKWAFFSRRRKQQLNCSKWYHLFFLSLSATPMLSVYLATWRMSGQTKGTGCQ